MELKTSKTFKWNLWKERFYFVTDLLHLKVVQEGIYLGYLGERENGREVRKSPQANLDSWVVFKACLSWRVVRVAEAGICYSIWSERES